ncbi:transmembrane GTPase fzo1 [Coleophoma crateriformis]|uniref:Transmembrane GTPase fzo1 n=1 Tax=Coleophoma crateriformis TaxID=565419 RepID=A0A3D8T897_9HELO|nr:transmembrane GTPase fzo1 [Coleophoma crateriformis]
MSQEHQNGKGKGSGHSAGGSNDANGSNAPPVSSRPQYVTVGSGSTTESAARLQAMLDTDSGYGGSMAGDSVQGWHPRFTEDRPSPAHSPMVRGESSQAADNERRQQASAIHQLWYNQHRVALGRSINRVVETLKSLQEMNASWPATYPSVQRAEASQPQRRDPRPGLVHTQSTAAGATSLSEPPRPGSMRRSLTSIGENSTEPESSTAAEQRSVPEPRLITPQIAQEFSILKLDLKLGALHQTELVHSLEKNSIASLLDGKISTSIKHLLSLRDRIEDTSSKVLVTGDLNTGKSTFCNALLRRKILPEDQQPCTSIFCEVLDARENGGVEEVHAVHKDVIYDRHDESTYDVFVLRELERIVTDNDTYTQCKVYVKDVRTIDESLLNNGVVDISIIDAPGLNLDTTKTTAVFARQEEIDVVVFVVSAANHFTQTAKEFIWAAAAEKAYIFIVVNGYDNIRDKQRCQKMILEQVAGLSPRTFKESAELVHFVSSNAIPSAPPGPGGNGGGSGSASGGGGDGPEDDDGEPQGKGKGKEKEKIRDFENLEQSLRRFVLEKRARSKLAPAKTYLLNVLGDVHTLATVNQEVAQSELDRVTRELNELEPLLEASKKAKAEVSDDIDKTIEATCKGIYDHTRSTLTTAIAESGDEDLGVEYPGLFNAFQYAEDLKEAILSQISASVIACEEHARRRTVDGVSSIKQLGLLHLGDEYTDLSFRSDVMFTRKRDKLAKQVEIETELWDFFDWSTIIQKQEKMAGTGMAMTVLTVAGGRMLGGYGWIDGALAGVKVVGNNNLRHLIIPGILATAVAATAYILSQIPHSLPHRLSSKVSAQLEAIDYVHTNSDRISSSVRKVLRFPADNLRVGLQRSVEQLGTKQEETRKVKIESEVARKYFGNLVNESAKLRNTVEAVDLEGPAPGVAAAYDS